MLFFFCLTELRTEFKILGLSTYPILGFIFKFLELNKYITALRIKQFTNGLMHMYIYKSNKCIIAFRIKLFAS